MNIALSTISNNQNFTGYDARKLKGLLVTDKACAEALKKLSPDTGLDIFTPQIASKSIRKEALELEKSNKLIWTQDYFTILQNHILFDNTRDFLKRTLRATSDGLSKQINKTPFKSEPHLRGGNFFVCQVGDKKKLLVDGTRLIYPKELFKQIYNVDEVCPIAKTDYHIDLSIRPLENGNVLVADNTLTKKMLQTGQEKLKKYITNNNLNELDKKEVEDIIEQLSLHEKKLDITLEFETQKSLEITPQIIQQLNNYGFNPIPVPATYHYLKESAINQKTNIEKLNRNLAELKEYSKGQSEVFQKYAQNYINLMSLKPKVDSHCGTELVNIYQNNFINAIVNKKDNNKINYITNASLLDKELGITPEIEAKTGFSTRKAFEESIAPYVDKFITIDEKLTERLFKYMGGIHCSASEIPL